MADRPTGTVTFLFTDIEGSTALWERHREWMERAFKRHEAIIRERMVAHCGYVYKMIGDAFQVAFATAPSALAAALDTQYALQSEPWGECFPLRVRMAVHSGATEERADDYVGPALNRAGRLLAAAHGGQILVSHSTYDLAREELSAPVEMRDLGVHRLKGLVNAGHIYQLTAPGLLVDFPPLETLGSSSNNLPIQLTSFIGRGREKREIEHLLFTARLVTLTGPGGTGKTRLAVQAAGELAPNYQDGVFFVPLAALSDSALVLPAIAQTLGLREVPGYSYLELLKEYLRQKEALLVLDNFEQLLPAGPVVSQLLGAAKGLKVLITSRALLHLYGEVNYPVPPLAVPDRRCRTTEELRSSESVALFVERARAVRPAFMLTSENAAAVSQICSRLDGLPLAIELAAARVRLFPPPKILEQLEHRLEFLTGGARDFPARQQTLRQTIAWSYNLLGDAEKILFRRLSVFAGGCTWEAAQALCPVCDDLLGKLMDGMTALVDHSLLYEQEGHGGVPRFSMLETVREFAWEQLQASGEAEAMRKRHAEYYAALLELSQMRLSGENLRTTFEEVGAEIENLRAGWDWALEHPEPMKTDTYLDGLAEFYRLRGRYQEGENAFARAVQRLRGMIKGSDKRELRILQGRVELQHGRFLDFLGDFAPAREVLQAALAVFSDLGARKEMAFALCCLGGCDGIYGAASSSQEIRSACEKGLAIFKEIDDQWGIAFALRGLGWADLHGGDYTRAKDNFQESMDIYRRIEDREGLIRSLGALGYVTWILGEYRAAENIHEVMRKLCEETSDRGGIARAVGDLAIDACGLGDLHRSRDLFEQSLAIYREIGDIWGVADELGDLAEVHLQMGMYERAVQLAKESLAAKAKIARQYHLWELRIIGTALAALGEFQEAAGWLRQALEVGRIPGHNLYAIVGVAGLFAAEGAREPALELLEFVLHHRATWGMVRDRAIPLHDRLAAELSLGAVATLEARGRARELESTIGELLDELKAREGSAIPARVLPEKDKDAGPERNSN